MKRAIIILAIAILVFTPVMNVYAEDITAADHLIISELQTGSSTSTGEDFVEIYNPSDIAVDMSGWTLEYRASGLTSKWTNRVTLTGEAAPFGRLLFSAQKYLVGIANAHFSSGFSKDGGSVRLRQPITGSEPVTIDQLGWGQGQEFETSPILALADGTSAKRSITTDDQYIDTNNNFSDYIVSAVPTPSSGSESPGDEPDYDPTTNQQIPDSTLPLEVLAVEAEITDEEVSAPLVKITELLPNPAAPQSDADDEFIELYNADTQTVQLQGYTLLSGTNLSYRFTIQSLTMAPGEYAVIYSRESSLALSNSSGRVRLTSPLGLVIDETPEYADAKEGQTFSRTEDGAWVWSIIATPGALNVITQPLPATTAAKAAAAKSAAKKKAKATAKKAAKKSRKPAAKGILTKADDSTSSDQSLAVKPKMNTTWLVGLGIVAVLYASWEYRHDIRNYLLKLRRNTPQSS